MVRKIYSLLAITVLLAAHGQVWSLSIPIRAVRSRLRVHASSAVVESVTSQISLVDNIQYNEISRCINQNYRSLDETTQKLLNATDVGEWNQESFEHVETIVKAWSLRQSRRAALEVERLLRRIVKEQQAGNPYADAVDMTALYTNLIVGWSNCHEPGGAERAEEILEYFQQIYEENDSYDPLLCGPCLESFNAVISAYAQSSRPDAPEQAIRVLGKLYEWIQQGRTVVKPNKETYAHVLRAYARKPSPHSPELILKMLEHMEELAKTYPSIKPDFHCYNVYIFAILEATNHGHMNNAEGALICQNFLEKMLGALDDMLSPDTWTFNMVLNAWSRSGSPEMVDRADHLISMLERYHDQSGRTAKTVPNSNTYNTLLSCYSRSTFSNKTDRAYALFQKMKNLYLSGENLSAKPDAITYNIIMNMFAKTKKRNSPAKVEELLLEMIASFKETRDRKMRPTTRTINTCIDAWAKSGEIGADDRILEWMERMKESDHLFGRNFVFRPDKWTYNSYLQALARSGKPNIGTRAEQVIAEMEELHRNGVHGVKPDVVTFTNVVHCIARSGQDDAVDRALATLIRLEDLHEQGHGDLRPNLFTYNCVINTIAKSKRPGKAKLALDILRRMEEAAIRPVTVSFNNVLNACAFTNLDHDEPEQILKIALDVLREVQKGPGANWITYQTAIRVVCSFEQDPHMRWDLTREIFQQCCNDGQLTRTVMAQVRFSVTESQFAMLDNEATDPVTRRLLDQYSANARQSMKAQKTRIVST